ncbi:hypothetical protein ACFVVP_26115 [Streptomyces sp. NPDC058128]|uniref:hypothetical protein n=1 Tax=Streptomyces sp. NPDC058128 TaxID=3346352 RepID=UPI0036E5244D
MDWIFPVSGLVGAVVGASASSITAVRVLKAQLSDARTAREDVERAKVVATLAKGLEALGEHARAVPEEIRQPEGADAREFQASQREAVKQWEATWRDRLRAVKVGALEI